MNNDPRPPREPFFGPNAKYVFIQFGAALIIGFTADYLLGDRVEGWAHTALTAMGFN